MRPFVHAGLFSILLFASSSAFAWDNKGGDAARGEDIFEQCGSCHNADKTERKLGPGLKGLFSKEKLSNGKKPTYDSVLQKINEGGNGMPAYKELLSDQEKKDLMAYLQTL